METQATGIDAARPRRAGALWNEDLAPTEASHRTWNRWHIAALWVGMSVCVTTYTLAAGLLKLGMTWWQAVLTIALGNVIVLVPMVLNGHPGTKYGIPFPVLVRASFGTRGSNVPAIARAIVACGWFGIQTWIGGMAIYQIGLQYYPHWAKLPDLPAIGINAVEVGCFLLFWLVNVWFIVRGTESIKWLETLSAPFLILIGVALLGWGVTQGGSLHRILEESAAFATPTVGLVDAENVTLDLRPLPRATRYRVNEGPWFPLPGGRATVVLGTLDDVNANVAGKPAKSAADLEIQFADDGTSVSGVVKPVPRSQSPFWLVFLPAITAMVGYWATLSLNIPDFTRYAKSQADQLWGQALGLPTTMAFYSFIGIAVTCAALVAFPDILTADDAPWDPVSLLGRFRSPALVIPAMIALLVATLTTNIAANVVSPANDFSNVAPRWVSYRTGGLLTAAIGVLMMPWKLIETTQGYIFTWLIGYGALLGPIAGIMIADYFVVRRTRLAVGDLYREDGRYGRWNALAIAIFVLAAAPAVPGFLVEAGFLAKERVPEALRTLYTYAWFVGFGIAFVCQSILGKRERE